MRERLSFYRRPQRSRRARRRSLSQRRSEPYSDARGAAPVDRLLPRIWSLRRPDFLCPKRICHCSLTRRTSVESFNRHTVHDAPVHPPRPTLLGRNCDCDGSRVHKREKPEQFLAHTSYRTSFLYAGTSRVQRDFNRILDPYLRISVLSRIFLSHVQPTSGHRSLGGDGC
jgi:hypothetical protein